MASQMLQERNEDRETPERAVVAQLFAEHSELDLDLIAEELDRVRKLSSLRHVIEVWDLSLSDVATIFSVSRQAVAKWVAAGPPSERAPAVAELAAATDLLVRHIKRDRIPAVVRRAAPGLGGLSLVELAHSGGTSAVVVMCRKMFAFEAATA